MNVFITSEKVVQKRDCRRLRASKGEGVVPARRAEVEPAEAAGDVILELI